jgi:uncharacterized protein YraI
MFSALPTHKTLYLLPLVTLLVSLLGITPPHVSGAPAAAMIRAEKWEHTAWDRSRSGSMRETYARGYRTRTYDSTVHGSSFRFNAIGPVWDAQMRPGAISRLWVRASMDGSAWSDWMAVTPDEDVVRTGANYGNLLVLSGLYAQYRLELSAPMSGTLPGVSRVSLTFIDSQAGPERMSASRPGVAHAADLRLPGVISRAGWGAQESLRYDGSGREVWGREYVAPRKAIIHETVTINNDPNPAATVRAIYYYHAVTRGWGDIGYNYLVDAQGRIYEGRAGGVNVVGGHGRCFNYGTVGISVLGEYSRTEPTRASVAAIERILAWEFERNGIDPYGHGSLGAYAPKDIPNIAAHVDLAGVCGNTHQDPGVLLRNKFPQIRNDVAALLGGAPSAPVEPAPQPAPAVPEPDLPRPANPAPEQPAGTNPEPAYYVRGTGGRGLYLREGPGTDSSPLLVVPEGTRIQEVTSPIDGWVWTSYGGQKGYLWHGYLWEIPGTRGAARPAQPSPAPPAALDGSLRVGGSAVISGTPGALNLRKGPGMEYPAVGRMWEGMGVTITGEPRGGWYPLVYTDGAGRELRGWAWGEYLEPGQGRTAQAAGAMALAGAMGLPAWHVRRKRRMVEIPEPVRR